jgi:AraC-like DNA-binding protein
MDLQKTPGGAEQRFRSIFLTFSPDLLNAFQSGHEPAARTSSIHMLALDSDMTGSLRYVLESIYGSTVSDERLRYRLMDLLAALAERGHPFAKASPLGVVARLRTTVGEAPERRWTAKDAANELAMSEATLRRRLVQEGAHFEDLLMDVRMHHAMMLMQTTSWNITRIAEASGYKSRTRFAERFRERFGYPPSSVR